MFILTALMFALASAGAGVETPKIDFKLDGKTVKSLSLEEIQKKPSRKLQVFERHEGSKISFQAISATALFREVFGKRFDEFDDVLFTCADGYQPAIPKKYFAKSTAYFAYKRSDGGSFSIVNRSQNEKSPIPLGPLYLIWDDANDAFAKGKGLAIWPYQVVGIELVQFKDRFPKLALNSKPPAKPSAAAQNGFLLYRENCLSCHTIQGEGGKKAKDLMFPIPVTRYRDENWIKQFLDNPARLMPDVKMGPFNPEENQRANAISDILEYLKAKALEPHEKS